MTPVEVVLADLVVTVGALLQGSIGFGLGMFSVPLLVLIDPQLVPGPLLSGSFVLTLLLAHREWRGTTVRDLKWALAGRIVGVGLAAAALTIVPSDRLALVFGVLVLCAVGLSASGLHVAPAPATLVGAGTLSGFMGTTVSIGGPPMALLYQRESGARLRGTLSAYFTVGVVLSLIGLHLIGRYGWHEVRLAAFLLPGIVLGYVLSRRTAGRLDRGYLRAAVLVVSALGGAVVIVRYAF